MAGWLSATPKDADGKPAKKTRREQARDDGGKPQEPPVTQRHVAEWLAELGWCTGTASGLIPLRPTEVQAWQDMAGVNLNPWEARTILLGSRAFVRGYYSESVTPPYGSVDDLADQAVIDARLERMFE